MRCRRGSSCGQPIRFHDLLPDLKRRMLRPVKTARTVVARLASVISPLGFWHWFSCSLLLSVLAFYFIGADPLVSLCESLAFLQVRKIGLFLFGQIAARHGCGRRAPFRGLCAGS